MMRAADISVVIPCYNREQRIGRAIESALAQTAPPLEIVVVDDGSDDSSAAVAESFGPPVRVFRTANRGASAARNLALREARGSWIAFLDSDDTWSGDKLEHQRRAVETFPDVDLVFTDTRALVQGEVRVPSRFALGGIYEAAVERSDDLLLFDRSLFQRLLRQSRLYTSCVLVRRREGLQFREDLRRAEDWALWLDLSLKGPFAAVDRVLVDMEYGDDNLSAATGKTLADGVRVLEQLLDRHSLSLQERESVERALRERRVGAVYHLLAEGRTRPARALLERVPREEIGGVRRQVYLLLTFLPSRWVSRVFGRGRIP